MADPVQQVIDLLEADAHHRRFNKLDQLFAPGFFYGPHLKFFAAGKERRERCFLAGNRTGKTTAGGFELVCHALGRYPDWWLGHRFNRPIVAWCAGDTGKVSRDVLQRLLLGAPNAIGTGLIPASRIERIGTKAGLADAVETIFIKHSSGGTSEISIKSYDQGRESFQGAAIDVAWLDEEPPQAVYYEALLRTLNAIVCGMEYVTATPMLGMTDLLREFWDQRDAETGKYTVQMSWAEAKHLPEAEKQSLLQSIPEFQRKARTEGVPSLGSGLIYPLPESDIVVNDFPIPAHYRRAYGMDVGFVNKTAVIWGAKDPDSGVLYLHSEYVRSMAEPEVHVAAIKSRGGWIQGTIDPSAGNRSQIDGRQLIEIYRRCGLSLTPAENAVESGLYTCWQLMSSGKLKVFRSLTNWLDEFRVYMRDEQGKVIKVRDHLMDATRYLCMAERSLWRAVPGKPKQELRYTYPGQDTTRWMA